MYTGSSRPVRSFPTLYVQYPRMTACPSGRQWNGLCSTCGQSWAIMFRMQACQITVIKFFSVFLFFLFFFFFFFYGHLHTLKTDRKVRNWEGYKQDRWLMQSGIFLLIFFCNAPWLRHLHKREMNVRYFMHSRSTLCKHVQYLNIQHTVVSLVTRVFFFLFLVFLILLVTTLHLIPQLVSSIFDLLVPRVFFILAFGSWVPVGQVGVLLVLVVTQLAYLIVT